MYNCKNKPFNYIEHNGKRIKFYDNIVIIFAKDTPEIVSIVQRSQVKDEWKKN